MKLPFTVDMPNSEKSAPALVETLIQQAEQAGASDIHLQLAGPLAQIMFRLDGVMTPASMLTDDIAERVFGRIKFLAKLKTYQNSLPQDGRIDKASVGACANTVWASGVPIACPPDTAAEFLLSNGWPLIHIFAQKSATMVPG